MKYYTQETYDKATVQQMIYDGENTWYYKESDIGWRWCSQEMPEEEGSYMIQVEIGGSIESMRYNGTVFLYYSMLQPIQWFKMPPPLEEEKAKAKSTTSWLETDTTILNLKKRLGELEAKAGKKRSFNALVIAHRDLIKKMNELLEEEG